MTAMKRWTHEFAAICPKCGWELIVPWPISITVPLDTCPIQVRKCPECGASVSMSARETK